MSAEPTKEELKVMYLSVLEEKKRSGYRHYPTDNEDRIIELYHEDIIESILEEFDESLHDSILIEINNIW